MPILARWLALPEASTLLHPDRGTDAHEKYMSAAFPVLRFSEAKVKRTQFPMKRRSASVSRNIPSTADLSEQTQNMFRNAGNDISPIRVRSLQDAMDEIEFLETNIAEGVEWDTQVNAMQRGMGLINGGALEFDEFLRGLNRISAGLASAATNLRSALVKQSCLFIAQIAREVGSSIDLIGEFIIPLSGQLSHGTQIIAECSKFAIFAIAKHCASRKVLKSILDISNSRGASVKATAAESLAYVLSSWPVEMLNSNMARIEPVLTKLLADAAAETRTAARKAARAYMSAIPNKGGNFVAKLDQRTQKAIYDMPDPSESRIEMKSYSTRATNDSFTMKSAVERRRPSPKPRNDTTKKPPERADIAANPPRVLKKPENSETVKRSARAPSASRVTRETTVQRQRNADDVIRTQRVRRTVAEEDYEEQAQTVRPRRTDYSMRYTKQQEPSYEESAPVQRLHRSVRDEPEYEEPVPRRTRRYRSDVMEEHVVKEVPTRRFRPQMDEEVPVDPVKRRRTITTRFDDKDDEEPKITYSQTRKRQSSVQPVRKDLTMNTEKRKPIKLEEGDEKNYLENLKSYINEERTSELASSMSFISKDLVNLCSNTTAVISSQALQILHDLIPVYAPHFRAILPSVVEMILGQCEIGNARSVSTAELISADLHRYFDSNSMLQICLQQTPSVPLLNFTESLVSLDSSEIDISGDLVCQKLLMLAFRCHNLGNIKTRHTAARVVQSVNDANSGSITRFANSLRDQQLRQFEEFISPYIPDLQFRTVHAEVPRFNPKSPVSWKRRVQNLVETMRDESEWSEARSKVLAELNEALLDRKESSVLDLVYNILSTRGYDDFGRILPGVLVNSRGETARVADSILTGIVRNCDPADVFNALHGLVTSSDGDLARASLGFQTRLIAMIDREIAEMVMPSMITGLTKSFEAELPEVRKAVVLCFVELYSKLGKELMDRHTSHLSKGQQKLIAIYLSRRK